MVVLFLHICLRCCIFFNINLAINFSHISKCTEESYATFNFISLIIKNIEHLFMYLLANIFL